MPERPRPMASPLAIWLLALGAAVAAMALAVLWWSGRVQALPAPLPPDQRSDPQRLAALARLLLASILILLIFVVGAILMMRVGRIVWRPAEPRPTRYVDAWSMHRISEQQIAELTREDEPPTPPDPTDA